MFYDYHPDAIDDPQDHHMVVTFQNGRAGRKLNLTHAQIASLKAAVVWLRDEHGHYTSVHYGAHRGTPTLADEEIALLLAGELVEGFVAT